MNNLDKRMEIKEVLFKHDKNISWLKNKMATKVDLYYLLSDRSTNFDIEIYEEIIKIFKREGFITSENERCERFARELITVNGIISHSTYLLNSKASSFIEDNILDFHEKRKLIEIVEKIKAEFNGELENIEKVIGG